MNDLQNDKDEPDFSAVRASEPNRVDQDQIPPELLAQLLAQRESVMGSAYTARIKELRPLVVGKRVVGTAAGRAGFALRFEDGSWAAACLAEDVLDWKAGAATSERALRALVDGVEARGLWTRLWRRLASLGATQAQPADVSRPLAGQANPFFAESVEVEAEVAHAIGHTVTALSYGADCFNFCFEDGHELETFVARLPDGRCGYRVHWTQW